MGDDSRILLAQLGKAQIDGLLSRQDEGPAIDDAEFLPLLEIVLTAFEKTLGENTLADELWEYAFAAYDRMCKANVPNSTSAENRKRMLSFLPGTTRTARRHPPSSKANGSRKERPLKRENSVPTQLPMPNGQSNPQLYTLEVSLLSGPISEKFAAKNPIVSRTIQIRGDQTLEDLHHAIFEAYGRWESHAYEFQFGKGPMDPKAHCYVLPSAFSMDVGDRNRPAGRVDQTTLDSLGLKTNLNFGYWFDFGDDWWHQISVKAIEDKVPTGKFPKVTKRLGKSPPQYAEAD